MESERVEHRQLGGKAFVAGMALSIPAKAASDGARLVAMVGASVNW